MELEVPLPVSKRILVADDEAFNIEASKGLIKMLKLKAGPDIVDYVYNGEQAVKLIEKAI